MKIAASLLLSVIALLAAGGASALADGPDPQAGKGDSVVSPLLQQFIQERQDAPSQHTRQPGDASVARGQDEGSGQSTGQSTKVASDRTGSTSTEATNDRVRFDDSGNVEVYIHLENTDDSTLQQLRGLGVTIEIVNSEWNVLQAWVPISAIDQIANLDAVQEITPPDYGVTKTGSINSDGDAIHAADFARAFSGLTGKGVKVGVISDGVTSWRTARGSGDLPITLETDLSFEGRGDEGTALLEIIHDLAPDAELAFAGAVPLCNLWKLCSGWPTRPSKGRVSTLLSTTSFFRRTLLRRWPCGPRGCRRGRRWRRVRLCRRKLGGGTLRG